jgi:SAM-dependent methyltransferase
MSYGYVESRPNALCPRCLALERHRLLWLWLTRQTDMLATAPIFLHIAPEVSLMRQFDKIYAGGAAERYVTADLESPLAKVKMDVQAIPFAAGSFDVIFCNHILEHVADDRRAMSEMYRVMRHGGWGVMLSPIDEARATTFEDDSVTDPAERTRLFGQYDHRRVYGRDYADRLRSVGWQVENIDYYASLTPAEQTLYALRPEPLYIVRKP